MHEHLTILGIALVVLGYGFFSRLLNRFNISGPMVFTAIGVLLSPLVLGGKPVNPNAQTVQIVAEVALITILFSDAAFINLKHLLNNENWRIPVRLLFVSLPISIILAYYTAMLFFPNEEKLYLLLLALFLAPTDAALGKAVVSDERIPERVRNAINVESGLNDGIVFPILLSVLVLISGSGDGSGWFGYVVKQIFIGAIAGGIIGYLGAKITQKAIDRGYMEHQYRNLTPIALAIFAYYMAEFVHGNGYISAFFTGLLYGNIAPSLRHSVEEFAESEGEFLIMISFLIYGLVFVPDMIPYLNMSVILYALISLTLIRMIPIVIGMGKLNVDFPTRMFISWFGPRGIASILYIIVAVHKLGSIEGHEEIFATASLTILLSIILHGISAQPLAKIFADRQKSKTDDI